MQPRALVALVQLPQVELRLLQASVTAASMRCCRRALPAVSLSPSRAFAYCAGSSAMLVQPETLHSLSLIQINWQCSCGERRLIGCLPFSAMIGKALLVPRVSLPPPSNPIAGIFKIFNIRV